MKKKIKTLLVGAGKIGYLIDRNSKKKISHFKNVTTNKKFKLVGVVDKKNKNIKLFKSKILTFTNINKAINELNPDLIVISSNTNTHLDILKRLINFNGIILLEKPLSNNLLESNEIMSLINKFKMNIFINYFREYFEDIIKELTKLSKSNEYKRCVVHYSSSIEENLPHHLSLILIVFKNIVSIKSLDKKIRKKDFRIYFKNGCVDILSNQNLNYKHDIIEIYDKKAFLSLQLHPLILKKKVISKDKEFPDEYVLFNKITKKKLYRQNLFRNVYENIYKSFYKKKYIKVSLTKSNLVDKITSIMLKK